jgi:hypothetical protein
VQYSLDTWFLGVARYLESKMSNDHNTGCISCL